jgi:hypothetical protein
MTRRGFEPAIPANKRLQTHALDRPTTGIGHKYTVRTEPAVLQLKAEGNTLFLLSVIIKHLYVCNEVVKKIR